MDLPRKIGRGIGRIFATPVPQLGRLDYDEYWELRQTDVHQPRFDLIARLVPRGATVADIGCGDGSLLRYLGRTREVSGWGVDISAHAIEIARGRGTDADVGDITQATFALPRAFDTVVVSEVLEHIADPEAALVRIRPSVGHQLIVTLPNTGYIEHRLRLLSGRFPVQWLFHPGEHVRFWTLADFKATAGYTGYAVASVHPALGWFPPARWAPGLFASQLVYRLLPRE